MRTLSTEPPFTETAQGRLPMQANPALARRRLAGKLLSALCLLATIFGVVALVLLLVDVLRVGLIWLDWGFLTSYPSRFPDQAGIKSALVGSVYMMGLTAVLAVPLGVATAVYLEEYAPRGWFLRFIQLNIANLAGVPSVIYGILGLALFVRAFNLDRSLLAGALTMALLILPVIVIASQEALRAIPNGVRESAFALGATRFQVIWHHLIPISLPSILTGIILSLSRAIGETAPLIMIGALTFIAFLPESLSDPFTVLPIQIFNWTSRPQADFQSLAASTIIVLMLFLFLMNLSAILLRNHFDRKRSI